MFQQSGHCPSYNRDQSGGTTIFPGEDYILVFLYFAGNKATYRQVSEIFGIAESTVFKIINTVMDFLVEIAPIFIKFPSTTAGKEALAEDFYKVYYKSKKGNGHNAMHFRQHLILFVKSDVSNFLYGSSCHSVLDYSKLLYK